VATSAYRTAVINDTPVFYAPLDEASLPADKKSGAVLEEVNGPTGASAFDSGWTFNGTDECLLVPATDLDQVAGWIGATGQFSLELWFKQNNGWNGDNVRYAVRWGGYGILLRFYGFSVGDQTGYVIGGFYSPDAAERNAEQHGTWWNNAWHHVVVTFDRPTLNLYIDGDLVQTESRDYEVQITDTESDFLGIGRDGPFSSGFFPGTIDDVAIYNYPLTETQVDAHYVASKTETGGDDPVLDDPPGDPPRYPPEGIASSFHCEWDDAFGDESGYYTEVRASLKVISEPQVDDLYFWALQASFYDSTDSYAFLGGAHTGLQWNQSHPENNAVNWGGYDSDDVELLGTVSDFPSTPDNDNTRDFEWNVGQTYEFRIAITDVGEITAYVDDVEIRTLYCAGADRLGAITMWSEVFAECSAPSVSIQWSGMTAVDPLDAEFFEDTFLLNYQAPEAHGCSNTNSYGAGLTVRQVTNTTRVLEDGEQLVLEEITTADRGGSGYIPIA